MQFCKAFLALLNAKRVTAEHWNNLLPQGGRGHFKAHPEHVQLAQQLVRQNVSAWIESGFQPNRIEMAQKRTCDTMHSVFQPLEKLFNCTLHDAGGVGLRGASRPSLFILQANYHNCPQPRGLLSLIINPRGGILPSPGLVSPGVRWLGADELAAWAFFSFWQSPCLFKLMQCARCGIFALPRTVAKSYKRGWHCKGCRNRASAQASTTESRKAFRTRWFQLAVDAYRKFDSVPRRAGHDKVLFITEQVNERLPAAQGLKRNTITRNLKAIQAAAEGGKDAKG